MEHSRRAFALIALVLLMLYGRPAAAADGFFGGTNGDPALLSFSGGSIGNIVATRDEAWLFGAEYRFGPKLEFFFIRPSLGVFVTTDSSLYGYFQLSGDIFFGKHIVLTPQAAVGGYSAGDGQDLGGTIEFKTGAVLAWRFENRARLGIAVHHISNAGIYEENPGTELLTLVYSHPMHSWW